MTGDKARGPVPTHLQKATEAALVARTRFMDETEVSEETLQLMIRAALEATGAAIRCAEQFGPSMVDDVCDAIRHAAVPPDEWDDAVIGRMAHLRGYKPPHPNEP